MNLLSMRLINQYNLLYVSLSLTPRIAGSNGSSVKLVFLLKTNVALVVGVAFMFDVALSIA